MKVNLSGVESKSFDPLPAGRYAVKVTDGEWKKTSEQAKNPGADMLNIEFTVQEGEFTDRKVWTNLVFVEATMWRVLQFLEATEQFTADQLAGEIDFELEDLIGIDMVLQLKVKPETADYDAGNDVKKFLKAGTEVSAGTSSSASLLP